MLTRLDSLSVQRHAFCSGILIKAWKKYKRNVLYICFYQTREVTMGPERFARLLFKANNGVSAYG